MVKMLHFIIQGIGHIELRDIFLVDEYLERIRKNLSFVSDVEEDPYFRLTVPYPLGFFRRRRSVRTREESPVEESVLFKVTFKSSMILREDGEQNRQLWHHGKIVEVFYSESCHEPDSFGKCWSLWIAHIVVLMN